MLDPLTPPKPPRRGDRHKVAGPSNAAVLEAIGGLSTATPLIRDVALELAVPVEVLARILERLAVRGLVDLWQDVGGMRVLLSERSAVSLGLRLEAGALRWQVPASA